MCSPARWAARGQGSLASLELAAPDISIPPQRARSALPTRPLRSALRLVRNAVATTLAPQDSAGPGDTPRSPAPRASFCIFPLSPRLPPTHPGCSCPCRQRQPAAPSHEHCGAPRVCNAERRLRAARAGSAAGEGGRERGGKDARGGGGRAPLPLAPGLEGRRANQRVQEEPSPLRVAFIGLARAAQLSRTRTLGQVCKLRRRSAAHRWRKRGNSGPVREAGSHGASTAICLLRLQVPSCARLSAHC